MTQDNRYIKFVQEEHRHFTNPPPVKRQSLGFSGVLGVIVITLVVVWFLK